MKYFFTFIRRAAKCKLLKVWHQLDVQVAKYHFEAADNAKFLGAMERYVHAIYLEVFIYDSMISLLTTILGSNGDESTFEEIAEPSQDDLQLLHILQ